VITVVRESTTITGFVLYFIGTYKWYIQPGMLNDPIVNDHA